MIFYRLGVAILALTLFGSVECSSDSPSLSARMLRAFSISLALDSPSATGRLKEKMWTALSGRNMLDFIELFGFTVNTKGGELFIPIKDFNGSKPDVNAKKYGTTPLLHVIDDGQKLNDGNIAWVNFLLLQGADINMADDAQQWTPLTCAITGRKHKMIKFLIEGGANATFKAAHGQSPIECAFDTSIGMVGMIVPHVPRAAVQECINNKLATATNSYAQAQAIIYVVAAKRAMEKEEKESEDERSF